MQMNIRCRRSRPAVLAVAARRTPLAQTPEAGGTLNFAVSAEPPNYDCHAQHARSRSSIRCGRTTTRCSSSTRPTIPKIKGDLAESWTVSQDGLTYTFKLREDVKFHDGSRLHLRGHQGDLRPAAQAAARACSRCARRRYEDIASIETPDPNTVVFKLSKPNASMLANFASPWDCVYSAAKLKKDPKFPERNIMGTGPFTFVEHVSRLALASAQVRGLLREGQALPRRLSARSSSAARRW